MPEIGTFDEKLAAAARDMEMERGSLDTMERAIVIATRLIDGCDLAGVSIVHNSDIDTPAASDDALRKIDELQYDLQEGPCLDALTQQVTVSSGDLSSDERWPSWGPRVAAELGMNSIVSYRLFTDEGSLGALNLYGREKAAFDADAIHDGVALAAHVAIALAGSQRAEHLEIALLGRTIIGQAQGILMERFSMSGDQAFALLSRLSSTNNVKLRTLAQQVVETRTIPEGRRT